MSRSRKIAVVGACPYPVGQGSQVYLTECARTYQELGHEVHVCVYGYGVGEAPEDLRVHRAPGVAFAGRTKAGPSWAKPFLDLRMVSFLKGVIAEHGIEVIDAHNYEGLLVALATGFRPIVYHAHNAMADELGYYRGFGLIGGAVGGMLDRTLPRRSDRVVAPHERLREYLVARGCDAAKVTVIAPGIDPRAFGGEREYGDEPSVLYAGNLDGYQNPGMLEAVMRRVRVLRPGTRCVLATHDGEGVDYAEVVSTGDVEALAGVLGEDGVFVCPRVSWSGYPIKLLNAMASGLAVVACAGSGYPVVEGETGYVVADGDVEAMAGRVVELLADRGLRERMGRAGRERSMELWGRRGMIEAVLEQVIS